MLPSQLHGRIVAISWRDLALTVGPFALLCATLGWLAIWLLDPAPPRTLSLAAGPEGSLFFNQARQYRDILARNGIKLMLVETEGSQDNLARLQAPHGGVDAGLVLDGVAQRDGAQALVSLGTVSHQPLMVFYRHATPITRLADFAGLRLSIGRLGSGARTLALALLKANGIEPGQATQLRALEADDAVQDLLDGEINAVFLMGDSARPETIRKLLFTSGIRLFSFDQADAYARRFAYLNKLTLPMGAFDLGHNIPAQTVTLVAPTVELVVRADLHPALSDLLIEAAQEVHGRRTVLQDAGEFPQARATDFTLSDDAARFYKSGKGFFYRRLPFWLASLTDRILLLLLPIGVLLIPGLRLLPWLYQWRIRSRIYRWYGALIALERSLLDAPSPTQQASLLARLDDIEQAVNDISVPLAYVDQLYVLREHIGFVRRRLSATPAQTLHNP
jgi:TRAP-type uncharacterized transport system substrate-binding protein